MHFHDFQAKDGEIFIIKDGVALTWDKISSYTKATVCCLGVVTVWSVL